MYLLTTSIYAYDKGLLLQPLFRSHEAFSFYTQNMRK